MLVALADTHAQAGPPLTDHLRTTIREADVVCHAGDFTTVETLEGFAALAPNLAAVHGNSDSAAVQQRLPATRTVDALGQRLVLAHGHDHDGTSLSLLARQENAEMAVVGHTHRPGVEEIAGLTVLNPGSHADPRGGQAAYACVWGQAGGVSGELRTPTGAVIQHL